jgi:hypothetical protein
VKRKASAYNFPMRVRYLCAAVALTICAVFVNAQDTASEPLSILTKELPAGSLWNDYGPAGRYGFNLHSSGGVGNHLWKIAAGAFPAGLKLDESGRLWGAPEQSGQFEFTVLLTDGRDEVRRKLSLTMEPPFQADWSKKSQVNGNRIDGSIKVSNTTGRDFDLTFVVLAVNEIGRATAIGYQHFPLKKNTKDMELPFGDTLSPGSYVVNVDMVGEEPVSKMIFRARLVAPKQTIAPTL